MKEKELLFQGVDQDADKNQCEYNPTGRKISTFHSEIHCGSYRLKFPEQKLAGPKPVQSQRIFGITVRIPSARYKYGCQVSDITFTAHT